MAAGGGAPSIDALGPFARARRSVRRAWARWRRPWQRGCERRAMLALRTVLGRCLAGPVRGGAAVLGSARGGDGAGEALGELGRTKQAAGREGGRGSGGPAKEEEAGAGGLGSGVAWGGAERGRGLGAPGGDDMGPCWGGRARVGPRGVPQGSGVGRGAARGPCAWRGPAGAAPGPEICCEPGQGCGLEPWPGFCRRRYRTVSVGRGTEACARRLF